MKTTLEILKAKYDAKVVCATKDNELAIVQSVEFLTDEGVKETLSERVTYIVYNKFGCNIKTLVVNEFIEKYKSVVNL